MIELTDIEEIKARMPVTYVLHLAGSSPEDRTGGDLMYLTPWRQDSNPSLACYADDEGGIVDRWRDMARSEGGDILDLIGMIKPELESFPDRLTIARKMYARFVSDNWEAPEPLPRKGSFDPEAYRAEQAEYQIQHDDSSLGSWLYDRDDYLHNVDPAFLVNKFQVSWVRGELKIPFIDRDGTVVVGKYRKPGEKTMSIGGTRGKYTLFYGEHLDVDLSLPVVLCEGEPDVWSGTHSTQDYVFLGLPSGAGTRPEKLQSRLVGRRVLLAFDGDDAGRDAAILWAKALQKDDNQVEIVPIPRGKDLSQASDIPGLLKQARSFQPAMPGLMMLGGRYHSVNKEGEAGQQLSDFTLTPVRVMLSPTGAQSFEVTDGRQAYLLTAEDLSSKNRFHSWAHSRGLRWNGTDRDTTILASNLNAESLFVPTESAAPQVGLFEGHIVWQGGSIGDRDVRYVPTGAIMDFDVRLEEGDCDLNLIRAMRELNDHSVTDPILAWAAAAMYRTRLPTFPTLNVSGISGSGKTTTLKAIIPGLTGSHIFQTLSSTTAYGVESLIAGSSGFPVTFDEYRPGGRDDTLQRLEQLARDAYDRTPSIKGSGGDNHKVMDRIATDAPIVISGEQSITETSHIERMILVRVVRPEERDGKHRRALQYVQSTQSSGLAYAFNRYIVADLARNGSNLAAGPVGPDDLPDRVRANLGILDFGWRVLSDFFASRGNDWSDDPDWSAVVDTTEAAVSTDPVADALEWALGEDRVTSVWMDGNDLCVRAASFVSEVQRAGTAVLPGNNAKTITYLFREKYGAYGSKRVPPMGSERVKCWVMSPDCVFPNEVD